MATLVVCAVRDSAVGAFNRPIMVQAVGVATRSFADEVNRQAPDNPVAAHPEDFELWVLGTWDEESGRFAQTEDSVRCAARAKDLVQQG